jgi:hypothetical protein
MNTSKPFKPEYSKMIQDAPLEVQPLSHYWDELRKFKRVKIVMDGNFQVLFLAKG